MQGPDGTDYPMEKHFLGIVPDEVRRFVIDGDTLKLASPDNTWRLCFVADSGAPPEALPMSLCFQ